MAPYEKINFSPTHCLNQAGHGIVESQLFAWSMKSSRFLFLADRQTCPRDNCIEIFLVSLLIKITADKILRPLLTMIIFVRFAAS